MLELFLAPLFEMTLVFQQCNRVGDSGAFGLSKGLEVNSSLQKLYLVSALISMLLHVS